MIRQKVNTTLNLHKLFQTTKVENIQNETVDLLDQGTLSFNIVISRR